MWSTLGAPLPSGPLPAPTPFEIYVDPAESVARVGPEGFDAAIRIRGIPEDGLFSFGVRLSYPADLLRVDGTDSIRVSPELDFNGPFGAGALRSLELGSAGIKGTIDLSTVSLRPFTGELLATVHLVPKDPFGVGSGRLELDAFRTLGPTESIFVTASGQVLDTQTSFSGGRFTLVPEPTSEGLLVVGASALCLWGYLRKGGHSGGIAPADPVAGAAIPIQRRFSSL